MVLLWQSTLTKVVFWMRIWAEEVTTKGERCVFTMVFPMRVHRIVAAWAYTHLEWAVHACYRLHALLIAVFWEEEADHDPSEEVQDHHSIRLRHMHSRLPLVALLTLSEQACTGMPTMQQNA